MYMHSIFLNLQEKQIFLENNGLFNTLLRYKKDCMIKAECQQGDEKRETEQQLAVCVLVF